MTKTKRHSSPSTHYLAAAPSWLDFKHNLQKRKSATIIRNVGRGFSPYIFLMPFWLILLISEIFETRIDETRKPTPSNKYLTTTTKNTTVISSGELNTENVARMLASWPSAGFSLYCVNEVRLSCLTLWDILHKLALGSLAPISTKPQ